ncbi:SGNH/GDSL hydrolase family protein [Beijerinckia indica]|uniref:Uncharacterized protein n=1 Tax=Beijerinckia indica subsp. indica (strain ATCC 9039 / DSM 1715 / NCIMB 8712) TaxID=395963 RepID=B2IG12_BEII9|nr:SGNH/GDSL hydrolase family protein [Beijerinckia indica]ACB95751.1 hypothetical protein Bind_2131 [Beijerinckia indica subsp. indica ATCC 9039]
MADNSIFDTYVKDHIAEYAEKILPAPFTADYKTYYGSGMAPGSAIIVYKDNVQSGTTTVAVDGTWSYTFASTPGAQSQVTYSGVPNSPAIAVPDNILGPLVTLSLSPLTGTASSAYIGTITGQTPGSTIVATSSDGTPLAVNGTTVSGLFTTGGTKTITLKETLTGATNSPNTTSINLAINAVSSLVPLTLSPLTVQAGGVFSGVITGTTSGSTVDAASTDGTLLTINGTNITGTFNGNGVPTISLTETLDGATNTPNLSTSEFIVSNNTSQDPAFSLARTIRVANGGTSLSANGFSFQTITIPNVSNVYADSYYMRGYMTPLMSLMGWNYENSRVWAVGGNTLAQVLANYNATAVTTANTRWGALGSGGWSPDMFFAEGGSNDLGNSLSKMETDATAVDNYLLSLNPVPRILNESIWPRTGLGNPSMTYPERLQFNQWREQKSTVNPKLKCYNLDALLQDPLNPGKANPPYTYDGVHPNSKGAIRVANDIFSKLSSLNMLPAPVVLPLTLDAAADPTNLLQHEGAANSARQLLGGTSGGLTNFAAGSTLCSGFNASADASWGTTDTLALPSFAMEADGTSTNLKRMVLTVPTRTAPGTLGNGSADATKVWMTVGTGGTLISAARASNYDGAGASIVAGNRYRAGCRLQIINGVNLFPVAFYFKWKVDGTVVTHSSWGNSSVYDSNDVFPDGTYDLLSPIFTIPSFQTSIELTGVQVFLGCIPGAPCGGTIKLSKWYIRPYQYLASWP